MALELHWRWHTLYAAIWSWTVKGCVNCLYEQLDKLNKVPQVSTRPRFPLLSKVANRPHSIYQYSNMAPRLSGRTSIFGAVFLEIERQKKLKKFTILARKPRSHVRILIYWTWPIAKMNCYIVETFDVSFNNFYFPCKHTGSNLI